MESPSSIHTKEEQQRLLTPHEYTGEAISLRYQNCIPCGYTKVEQQRLPTPHEYTGESLSLRYQDCVSCHRRTEFTCVKCGYCYSCHWRKEEIEEIELRDRLKDFYVSLSKVNDDEKQNPQLKQDEETGKWRTLNVLGQPAEPICNYYGCHH
jgi:hypothetical protein